MYTTSVVLFPQTATFGLKKPHNFFGGLQKNNRHSTRTIVGTIDISDGILGFFPFE